MNEVLRFWFGESQDELEIVQRNYDRWFKNGQTLDQPVREQFSDRVAAAARGELDHWMDSPRGAIALLITLDQFPRHIFRADARAFDNDAKALKMCLQGVESGLDKQLSTLERTFFYLPMEHAEDLAMQERGVALMHENTRTAPESLREFAANAATYGVSHRDIIAQFGRFPHRNEVLGRPSTAEEIAWLEGGGQRFGQ